MAGGFDDAGMLAVIGGISIALGALTYSKRVMMTVGARLVRLDAYAALVAVFSEAVTVHVFASIGVPVSTSQALVGGVIAVGLMRGTRGIHRNVLKNIGLAWLLTPVVAGVLAGGMARVLQLV
jgi:PiT family inorganic phosphate transporter